MSSFSTKSKVSWILPFTVLSEISSATSCFPFLNHVRCEIMPSNKMLHFLQQKVVMKLWQP